MMGPYSIGMAYYGAVLDSGTPIEENWINRYDSENFSNLVNYNEHKEYKASNLFGIRLPTNISMDDIKSRLIKSNIIVSYRGDCIVFLQTYIIRRMTYRHLLKH